jgi:hypothetical protein
MDGLPTNDAARKEFIYYYELSSITGAQKLSSINKEMG